MSRFLLFAGTRPEIIKLRPVYDALVAQGDEPVWAIASQSPDLIPLAFGNYDERIIRVPFSVENYVHPLVGLHKELTHAISYNVPLDGWKAAVVHGDTQTAASAALVCALAAIPVAHVEAGLRTHKPFPWPEEQNRRMIASLVSLHLAPTHTAKTNLRNENVDQGRIIITGQTGIDALYTTLARTTSFERASGPRIPRIVVTCHRRENTGRIPQLVELLKPLRADHYVFWPHHPNYDHQILKTFPFADPQSHVELIGELQYADLVITDSGGIIEEAAELEKPCLIIRDETERPEAIDHGCWLVTRAEMDNLPHMIRHMLDLDRPKRHSKGLYGDGHAGAAVARALRMIRPS